MPQKTTKSFTYTLFLILLPILFTGIIYIGYSQAKQQYREAGIRDLDRQMNAVFHLISIYHHAVKAGHLNAEEAMNRIKELLSGPMKSNGTRDLSAVDLTLGPGDYLFILDSKGNLVMHPELEGKNLYHYQNAEGRYIVQEMISQPNQTLFYEWQNPTDAQPRPKLSIIRYFPAWDWYVGISTYEENFYRPFSKIKYLLILLVLGSYIITGILYWVALRKERDLRYKEHVSQQLAQTNQSILKTLAVALEERDAYTSGHSQRVAYYMRVIAQKMGFSEEMLDTIYTGGLLHDIGKIGIGDSILMKPGKLTPDEYEGIKSHPVRGEALLKKLYAQTDRHDRDKVNAILTITRSHHERFDGRGYPDRLAGEEIPLIARIAAVADSFDAMTSNRAYRRGLSFSKACLEIQTHAGTQFCPQVVEAFMQSVTEETFFHAHQITRVDDLLLERIDERSVEPLQQAATHRV
ncbi:HD domain-containing protein [Brevibacillus sp. SYP-B805]|uniref:HD domain-containing phosphohydrolase n=1 Tax=Brevibacillus sp. SYP-B805 TaxID=1578199 RepID=UPI0013EA7159|nr:HD domain-containing phosphohydrolase [Brevibacillus sp. SYP-B805]NGQ97278.1 HD domain-containing protein [Brevibacillus sp. SYP-B805]